jgi:hypothetical protein
MSCAISSVNSTGTNGYTSYKEFQMGELMVLNVEAGPFSMATGGYLMAIVRMLSAIYTGNWSLK